MTPRTLLILKTDGMTVLACTEDGDVLAQVSVVPMSSDEALVTAAREVTGQALVDVGGLAASYRFNPGDVVTIKDWGASRFVVTGVGSRLLPGIEALRQMYADVRDEQSHRAGREDSVATGRVPVKDLTLVTWLPEADKPRE